MLVLLWSKLCLAQGEKVALFSFWKPKAGQAEQFDAGYKRHLQWHADHKDRWGWYAWYFISGPRTGMFLDVTADHQWSDFDNPVSPQEDRKDVALQVSPFGEFLGTQKLSMLHNLSYTDSFALKSNYLRAATLTVSDIGTAKGTVSALGAVLKNKGLKNFMVYQVVDGAELNQIILLIGHKNFSEMSLTAFLANEIETLQKGKLKSITSVLLETLRYRPDLSWFPE